MKEFNAAGGREELPLHPPLSRPLARHNIANILLGTVCAAVLCGLLALLFSLG